MEKSDLYYVFVLGYDLFQSYLKENEVECEDAFEICQKLYEHFLKSSYSSNVLKSTYENLQQFIEKQRGKR